MDGSRFRFLSALPTIRLFSRRAHPDARPATVPVEEIPLTVCLFTWNLDTQKPAEELLASAQDLLPKACGMLRKKKRDGKKTFFTVTVIDAASNPDVVSILKTSYDPSLWGFLPPADLLLVCYVQDDLVRRHVHVTAHSPSLTAAPPEPHWFSYSLGSDHCIPMLVLDIAKWLNKKMLDWSKP